MDFQSLQLFVALADNLHFGRTSEQNHISPSTLSRSIKRLENSLGMPLLIRDNRTVQLTPQGQMLKDYGKELLQDWAEFQTRLHLSTDRLAGSLTVFASVTASQTILPVVLGRFREKYPQIPIQLETGYALNALQKLKEGSDVVVASLPEESHASLVQHIIQHTPVYTIAPKGKNAIRRALAQRRVDWSAIPLVLPTEGQVRQDINKWFHEKDFKPLIYSEVAGNEAMLSLVTLGCGVGFVPRLVLNMSPFSDSIEIVKSGPALSEFRIGFCALRKSLHNNPLIRAFWNELPAVAEGG